MVSPRSPRWAARSGAGELADGVLQAAGRAQTAAADAVAAIRQLAVLVAVAIALIPAPCPSPSGGLAAVIEA